MTCPHHDADSCCTACVTFTDALGFPHFSQAKGRRVLQQCPDCRRWVDPITWVSDLPHAVFCCVQCAPAAYERVIKQLESYLVTAGTSTRRAQIEARLHRADRAVRKLVDRT